MLTSIVVLIGFWLLPTYTLAQPIGQVKSVQGVAQVRHNGQSEPLRRGALVTVGDTLVTGADSTVTLVLIDGAQFVLGPDAEMALALFQFHATTQAGQAKVYVRQGTVAVTSGELARANPGAMRIETPQLTLAIQATHLVLYVEEARP